MKTLNVLSLFDGISCGQIALERAGISLKQYFASEIDRHAIKVTQNQYPNTIQLGDVTRVKSTDLPEIDLLIGGSPCQGFSFAGKKLNFDDERSKLFFEYVRLLEECKPKYFLLENVKMRKDCQKIISDYLGVEPIKINSNLVSAQNRVRLYWTNIPFDEEIKGKGLCVNDIVNENNACESLIEFDKDTSGNSIIRRKDANGYKFIPLEKHTSNVGLVCIGGLMKPSHKMWLDNGKLLQRNFSQGNRVYSSSGKSASLNANSGGIGGKTGLYEINGVIRKLDVLECERLQTVPDHYTKAITPSQAIKALGNGWTVDVISHILKGIKENED